MESEEIKPKVEELPKRKKLKKEETITGTTFACPATKPKPTKKGLKVEKSYARPSMTFKEFLESLEDVTKGEWQELHKSGLLSDDKKVVKGLRQKILTRLNAIRKQ